MLTKKSIIFLKKSIGEIYSFCKLNEGFQNTIYKIESQKGDFCLRISKRDSKKHVQYEVSLLSYLKKIPVIRLQSVDGNYIFSIEGNTAILYSYIDGNLVEDNSLEELKIVGQFLGEFHSLCVKIKYPKDCFEFYSLPDKVILEHKNYIYSMNIPHKKLLSQIVSELRQNTLSDKQPSGPIHVDFGPKNTLWRDGTLVAVLDFDNAYNGPYILDLGKSIMFFASSQGKFYIPKAKAFFDGYISKRIISDNEKDELYKAIKFSFLSHIFVDYFMYAKKVTTKKYFDYIIKDLFVSYEDFSAQLLLNPNFLYEAND